MKILGIQQSDLIWILLRIAGWVWLHLRTADKLALQAFKARYIYGAIAF
ncbi:hypothetical protein H1Q63_15310 [Desmonostoc muscorum CCALA 125]|uniref:Uncharacterized protein n=1 Tax=Desmonostoc muscorum LEGE 12446 TaxID=1828758 RepID=A0A8J7AEI1_DESMC|nr:hypothetical protein [Desmonostoc muscorum]MBX9255291.1 hypothetical protein [Desmonostoc muscorum CCALA 125]MCF2150221.1 hypothetical protein [Desmonostoc muscorum LEGE 12446]